MEREAWRKKIEDGIWRAAAALRGTMPPAQYREVILDLVFLKYVSEQKKAGKAKILIPEEACWDRIITEEASERLQIQILEALQLLETANPSLKDVFFKYAFSQELDHRRLAETVRIIDCFDFGSLLTGDMEGLDVFGTVYEYCLDKFEAQNSYGGEFYTPPGVIKILVEILRPTEGIVYDPCCGSGNLLVQAARYSGKNRERQKPLRLVGQDSNPCAWRIAKMNFMIEGLDADLGTSAADIFFEDLHQGLQADYILANPPFNQSSWGFEELRDDDRWVYGLPSPGNGNFAWLQHMLCHLGEGGRLGLVLSNGSLSSTYHQESVIRKNIVQADLLDCIIALPPKLFYTTQMPASLWFLTKKKKQKNKTLFLDAEGLGVKISRKYWKLTEEELKKIILAYWAFQEGKQVEEEGFCHVAETDQISENHYVLTPGRYIKAAPRKWEEEEELSVLVEKLEKMFEENQRLQNRILDGLRQFTQQTSEDK